MDRNASTSAPATATAPVRIALMVDVGGAWIVYHASVDAGGITQRVVSGADGADGADGYGCPALAAAVDGGREIARAVAALLTLQGD